MSGAPFMPLYIGDYLADTVHLNGAESGAYLHLLMGMWRSGGALPNDPAKLARYCKITRAQWERVTEAVMPFFEVYGETITNPRLAAELRKYEVALTRRVERASSGGKAKALKYNSGEGASSTTQARHKRANQNQNQNQKEEAQPPLEVSLSDADASSDGSLRAPPVSQAVIDEIWAETPRKARDRSSRADVGKALRAAAQRGYSPTVIRPALRRYYLSDQANDDDRRAAKGLHRMIECDRWRDWTDDRPLLQIVRTPSEQVEYESAAAAYVERQARSQGIADVQA